MNRASVYAVKVWLTAIFTAPTLLYMLAAFINIVKRDWQPTPQAELVGMYLLVIIAGGLLSLPSMLILLGLTNWLQTATDFIITDKRLILSVAGIVLAAVPVFFIGWLFNSAPQFELTISAPYAVAVLAGIWYYDLD